MKAIHNPVVLARIILSTVFNISKIQNESNSQHCKNFIKHDRNCVQYFKDTK